MLPEYASIQHTWTDVHCPVIRFIGHEGFYAQFCLPFCLNVARRDYWAGDVLCRNENEGARYVSYVIGSGSRRDERVANTKSWEPMAHIKEQYEKTRRKLTCVAVHSLITALVCLPIDLCLVQWIGTKRPTDMARKPKNISLL